MRRAAVLAAVLACAATGAAKGPSQHRSGILPEHVKRLAARWEGTSPGGKRVYEHWVLQRGQLHGQAGYLTARGDSLSEASRIEQVEGEWLFLALPRNQRPALFVLEKLESTDLRWVFTNPEHDFPQQLVYEFVGPDSLYAYAGNLDGQSLRPYRYRRIR